MAETYTGAFRNAFPPPFRWLFVVPTDARIAPCLIEFATLLPLDEMAK